LELRCCIPNGLSGNRLSNLRHALTQQMERTMGTPICKFWARTLGGKAESEAMSRD